MNIEFRLPDLIVVIALRGLVGDGMNVHGRVLWLTGELTKLLAKLFLKLVGKTILGAEEDDTSLGN